MRSGILVVVLGLVVFAGCSNSGSDTNSQMLSSYLYGDYLVVEFGVDTAAGVPQANRFTQRFEGDGLVQGDADRDGIYEPVGTYRMKSDLTFDLDTRTTGILSLSGEVLASGTTSELPGLWLRTAVRVNPGSDPAIFGGHYLFCIVSGDAGTGECSTSLRSGYVTDVGRMTWRILSDSSGATGTGIWMFDLVDGKFDLGDYTGTVTFDGGFMVAAKQDAVEGSILIGVRRDLTSPDCLSGRYVGYSFAAAPEGCATSRFEMQADGTHANTLGTWSDGGRSTESFPYTISPEGFLSIDGTLFGAVTDDGGMFIGVETDPSDGDIALHVGIRSRN